MIDGKLQNQLYIFRAKKKWSQKELAEKLGVSRQTIISLESNRYSPSLVLAFKIATLFESDINEIFKYEVKGESEIQ
ncbi:helix-turn-helix transcriptional regulator [Bacillus thuringiensis]|uniref:helix-turn-helix transcriptional regulator n=1 Tax=Bacillus cereus group TaxID=86661 RepID=UPI000BEDFE01|nr:helix-turn-helix transcriptional regulator [Bacillus thuringiensis]MCU5131751.1 helix-turn-helix transcriptional regulator [Bacillus cereus]MCU5544478.1 helix-turn-helix transcriptional regulator [Bacillus cereus]MED3528198.1 helix-turn-helix transcriptional regulator [Bacillus thuringiensis]PEA58513.1 transcriptional regulator [Bacillus thuringiensis]PEW23739.1 transcriptional regulator [Bacillus thuringiensis]